MFGLEDGLRLIATRSRLMQQLPHTGLMAVVFAPCGRVERELESLGGRVSVAAANGPENTVISGEAEAVQALVGRFAEEGVGTQLLTVSHAFHSPLMEPILDEFEAIAAKVQYQRPQIPLISNLTGRLVENEPLDAAYWRRHIRSTVRFAEGMRALAEQEPQAMLEVGPTASLLGMGRRCLPDLNVFWLPSLRKGQEDWPTLSDSLSQLYLLGAKIDWRGFDRDYTRRRLVLPTYPFERERYWFDSSEIAGPLGRRRAGTGAAPAAGQPCADGVAQSAVRGPAELSFAQVPRGPPGAGLARLSCGGIRGTGSGRRRASVWPRSARVGKLVDPASHVPAGGERSGGADGRLARNRRTVLVRDVQHAGRKRNGGSAVGAARVRSFAPSGGGPNRTARSHRSRGSAEPHHRYADARRILPESDAEPGIGLRPRFPNDLRPEPHARRLLCGSPPAAGRRAGNWIAITLHPALGDALFQSTAGIIPLEQDGSYSPYTYMPMGVRRVRLLAPPAGRMYVYSVRRSQDDRPSPESVEGDVFLLDEQGQVLVEMLGVRVQRVGRGRTAQRETDVQQWLYQVHWQPAALPADAQATRTGRWLILADQRGVAAQLASRLREATGQDCVLVHPGEEFLALPAGEGNEHRAYRIDPLSADDYKRLLAETFGAESAACAGVVHLWSLDIAPPAETASEFVGRRPAARLRQCLAVDPPAGAVPLLQDAGLVAGDARGSRCPGRPSGRSDRPIAAVGPGACGVRSSIRSWLAA